MSIDGPSQTEVVGEVCRGHAVEVFKPILEKSPLHQAFSGQLGGCDANRPYSRSRNPSRPEYFKDEDELRAIWIQPDTRWKSLEGLAESGYGRDQSAEMQKIIDAENSDSFDVLAHVVFALTPLTRTERAENVKQPGYPHYPRGLANG